MLRNWEPAGVYKRSVWAVLEDRFELMLVNASARQAMPRPQDRRARRALALPAARRGIVRPELRSTKADPHAPQLDPLRKTQIADRQREAARRDKILEGTGIKLGCVATDILGKPWLETRSTRSSPGPPTRLSWLKACSLANCARRSTCSGKRSSAVSTQSTR